MKHIFAMLSKLRPLLLGIYVVNTLSAIANQQKASSRGGAKPAQANAQEGGGNPYEVVIHLSIYGSSRSHHGWDNLPG